MPGAPCSIGSQVNPLRDHSCTLSSAAMCKCAMAAMLNVQRPKLHPTHLQTLRGPVGWCLMCLHLIYCKCVQTSTEAFQFSITSLNLNYTTYLHLGRNASKNLHTHEHIIAGLAAVLTNYYLLFSDNMIFFLVFCHFISGNGIVKPQDIGQQHRQWTCKKLLLLKKICNKLSFLTQIVNVVLILRLHVVIQTILFHR